ncbi:DUF378 domain-containing protein [Candidatus Babeliales bacterium]|nr:DUF378 domain-containing protein [Candidatus Babeliales bacterium]
MKEMLSKLAAIFSAVGAINWGLVIFLRFDLVGWIHNLLGIPYVNAILYGIIALSGVYSLFAIFARGYFCE